MTPSWKHEVIGRIERAAGRWRRPRPGFRRGLCRCSRHQLAAGPAVDNAAARERRADWYVRSQGLPYAPLSPHDGPLARGHGEPGGLLRHHRERGQAPGHRLVGARIDDTGGAILDPELAPMRAAFQEALFSSPGGRIGGGDTAFKDEPAGRKVEARAERDGQGAGSTST